MNCDVPCQHMLWHIAFGHNKQCHVCSKTGKKRPSVELGTDNRTPDIINRYLGILRHALEVTLSKNTVTVKVDEQAYALYLGEVSAAQPLHTPALLLMDSSTRHVQAAQADLYGVTHLGGFVK